MMEVFSLAHLFFSPLFGFVDFFSPSVRVGSSDGLIKELNALRSCACAELSSQAGKNRFQSSAERVCVCVLVDEGPRAARWCPVISLITRRHTCVCFDAQWVCVAVNGFFHLPWPASTCPTSVALCAGCVRRCWCFSLEFK
jgi:hypothetical protein